MFLLYWKETAYSEIERYQHFVGKASSWKPRRSCRPDWIESRGRYEEVLYQLKLMDLKIEAMDSKFEAKFQTLFWAVGLIAAAIIAIATKLLFM